MKQAQTIFFSAVVFLASFGTQSWAVDDFSSSDQSLENRIAELRELREKDPETFKKQITEHQSKVHEKLNQLRTENPEKFKEVLQKKRGRLHDRMKTLRLKNPEQFQKLMQERRERVAKRAEHLKKEHPEQYQKVMERRAERLEHLKEASPERYEKFAANHPNAQARFQNAHPQMMSQPAQLKSAGEKSGNKSDPLNLKEDRQNRRGNSQGRPKRGWAKGTR